MLLLLLGDRDAPKIDNQGYLQLVPTQNHLKTTQNCLDSVLTYNLSLSCCFKYLRIPLFLSMLISIHVDPPLLYKLAQFCSDQLLQGWNDFNRSQVIIKPNQTKKLAPTFIILDVNPIKDSNFLKSQALLSALRSPLGICNRMVFRFLIFN